MNYGSWISHNHKRPLGNAGDTGHPEGALLEITNYGWQLLGVDPGELAKEEADSLNEKFLFDTGETFDDYLRRMVNDPRSDETPTATVPSKKVCEKSVKGR